MDALSRQSRRGIVLGEKEERSAFLTYLLAQKNLTPEEAMSHAVDMMMGGVETVRTDPKYIVQNIIIQYIKPRTNRPIVNYYHYFIYLSSTILYYANHVTLSVRCHSSIALWRMRLISVSK